MDLRKASRGLLCVFGLSFAATSVFGQKTQLTAYVDDTGGQHILYLDANSHLNQLYYLMGTTWLPQDLTGSFGGNTPNANSSLTSFIDGSTPAGQHVFYLDSNQHLNQLYYPGTGTTWIAQDLTASYASGLPTAASGSWLASFFLPMDGSEHVFYLDGSNNLVQFYYPGTGTTWTLQPLSVFGGNTPASGSALVAFADNNSGEHVVYLDSNGHINQLYYPGTGTAWIPQDLTATAGGNTPATTSNLTAYLDFTGGQHIAYEDSNQHINQIFYIPTSNTWMAQDVTATQGGNTPASNSHLASYVDNLSGLGGGEHIVYLDGSQHVNQLYYPATGTTWFPQDLTGTFGGNTAGSSSVLVAFPMSGDQFSIGQHIAYLDGSDNVNQIFYTPSTNTWMSQNLTSSYGGNAPAIVSTGSDSFSQEQ